MLVFGLLGYVLQKLNFGVTPLVLAMVLGPLFEQALSQSLTISDGSILIFFTRPISLALLVSAILFYATTSVVGLKDRVAI